MDRTQLRALAAEVSIDRVLERIEQLAQVGRADGGGVSRLAFSAEESAAMRLVAGWMEQAGLTVSYDRIGNMFGSTDAGAAQVVMSGSHLDTVPNGGAYDGALGVIGALEAVEAMCASGSRPSTPLEVVVWRCEEAARFGQGRLGSLYFTGELTRETLLQLDTGDVPLSHYLEEADRLHQRDPGRRVRGYLELHIEQSNRLESAHTPIGIVTAIPGATRWRIRVTGRADHSGATPMGKRRDALAAAAEVVLAVERAGVEERSRGVVATAVAIHCQPAAWNVVPGSAEVWTDVRGIESRSLDRTLDTIRQITAIVATQRGVEISIEEVTRGTPARLDESILARVEETARSLGLAVAKIPSGAGHDAQTIAPHVPTGMIFIPSVGGISHSPQEQCRPEDILSGIQVLAGSWASMAE